MTRDRDPHLSAHNNATLTPFSGLTPDVVLDALQAVGFLGDGRLAQLNSFENRVFQVMLEDGQTVVTKFYRPQRWSDDQIAEEHRFSQEAADEDIPVVAPLTLLPPPAGTPVRLSEAAPQTLAHWEGTQGHWRFAVWPRKAGRTPELEDAEVLQRLGSCLARLHTVGARQAFEHRHSLRILDDAQKALVDIEALDILPPDQKGVFLGVGQQALARIAACCGEWQPLSIRLHGDCHPGNLLWRDDQPNLVDLDDACNGPAVQDLWMLLSGDPEEAQRQLRAVLYGYEQVRPFDRRELRLIEPLRLFRMLRHNAWVAQRWEDPAFPIAYPDFGSSSYWSQQAMQLRDQMAQGEG